MKKKQFVSYASPNDKFEGTLAIGSREIVLPKGAVVSITLGEKFSFWKTMTNATVSQLVLRQMQKTEGLLYAEVKGHLKEGYGLTLSVWERKAMAPFRDKRSHKSAMKRFGWVFYSGSSQAYFLTYKANGTIPSMEEAYALVKAYGRYYDGGRLMRSARKPALGKVIGAEKNKTV